MSVHKPTLRIDLQKYSGKWYVIASIPTRFDRNWENVTETYTLNGEQPISIETTFTHNGKSKAVSSRGFPDKDSGNQHWKVQFLWPFRVHYLIEEIADDYSWVVVGHPRRKFLYIMARSPKMDPSFLTELSIRMALKGYKLDELHTIRHS